MTKLQNRWAQNLLRSPQKIEPPNQFNPAIIIKSFFSNFRSDKEKGSLGNELQEVVAMLEQVKKQKSTADKNNRALEEQLNDYKSRLASTETSLQDAESKNHKSSADNSNLSKQLEDAEHKLGLSKKENKNLDAQLQDARNFADDESKVYNEFLLKIEILILDLSYLILPGVESFKIEKSEKSNFTNFITIRRNMI